MLIKLGVVYGSEESISIIDSVFKTIAVTAVETSLQLAKTEGCYPMCNKEALVKSNFIKALNLPENIISEIKEYGLFNNQLLTCAPTGSIATMVQVSSGVEPNYAFSFTRRTVSLNKEETYYTVDADIVSQYKKIHKNIKNLPNFFIASQDINPYDRLKVQATLQKWIDASISSTLNLPESTTVEDIFNIYIKAWELGCKGITIWRDNCQRQGILSTNSKDKSNEEVSEVLSASTSNATSEIEKNNILKRGEIIPAGDHWLGLKRTLVTGCGTLHCEAFFDPKTGELRECYLSKGSTGGCNSFMIGLSRMISLSARGGVPIEAILDQLKSCGVCPSYAIRHAVRKDVSKGSCCPVAVGNALRDMYNEIQNIICECNEYKLDPEILPGVQSALKKKGIYLKKIPGGFTPESEKKDPVNTSLEECPNCHEKTLIHQGGCVSCTNCCWTKCD